MLVHNAHAVYRSKYITEKVDACANIVALFLSVPCPWLQRRCSCQKYSYIPTLFMTVLCSILCKCKLLTQRLTAKFLLHPQLGGTSGVSECTHVLYVHCTFILGSARALTSLYRQYRLRQNHCQRLAPDQSGALKKLTSAPTKPLTHNYDHYIMIVIFF